MFDLDSFKLIKIIIYSFYDNTQNHTDKTEREEGSNSGTCAVRCGGIAGAFGVWRQKAAQSVSQEGAEAVQCCEPHDSLPRLPGGGFK